MKWTKRFLVARFSLKVAILLTLLLLICVVTVAAQLIDTGSDGFVGTWQAQVYHYDCKTGAETASFSTQFTFAEGGIMTQPLNNVRSPATHSMSHGYWQRNGDNMYSALMAAPGFAADGASTSPQAFVLVIEAGNDPDEFSGHLTYVDDHDNIVVSACAAVVAYRVSNMPEQIGQTTSATAQSAVSHPLCSAVYADQVSLSC